MHLSDDAVKRLAEYADLTVRREAAARDLQQLDERIEVERDELLPELRAAGAALVIPTDGGGEFTVRADRDEDGEFICVTFVPGPRPITLPSGQRVSVG